MGGRTTRHPGYAVSQAIRKRVEEHFGWGKTVGRIHQTVYRGLRRVDQHFKLTMTASYIVHIARMSGRSPLGALREQEKRCDNSAPTHRTRLVSPRLHRARLARSALVGHSILISTACWRHEEHQWLSAL
jgi:hypothetical protein